MYDFDNNVDLQDDSSAPTCSTANNEKNKRNDSNNHPNICDHEMVPDFKEKNNVCQEQTISSQTSPTHFITSDGDTMSEKISCQNTCENQSNKSSFHNDVLTLEKFPETIIEEFDNYFEKSRWVMGIPHKRFEHSLDIAIEFIKLGKDEQDENCQHFLYETIVNFFGKYCLDATSEPQMEEHRSIFDICLKLTQIVVLCMKKNPRITELLSNLFSTNNWFSFISLRERRQQQDWSSTMQYTNENDIRNQNSLLFENINYFGKLGGFDVLLSCFTEKNLTSFLIYAYIKPFDQCRTFLSSAVLEKYFVPILEMVPKYYENLSDQDLKNELKSDGKNDVISLIVKICRNFCCQMKQEDKVKLFEFLSLKLTLRVLQLSSFSGKMNALNEINKTILFYNTEERKFSLMNNNSSELIATSREMAQWLIENDVLEIILKDCLHQPQYVEKLDNIIRFLLKENALSIDCLDKIWNSQLGKHEIIVKNIHDLIAKLAWNFSADQLNHLFICFKSSWSSANKKEREKLLELMRRLAEDDKDGSMANKVLLLLWNIAYNSDEVDSDIVDQALSAHVKILDYSKTGDKDSQKINWLQKCITEINRSDEGNNVITAMKQIREISLLFPEQTEDKPVLPSKNKESYQQRCNQFTRKDVLNKINVLFKYFTIPQVCIKNLKNYMKWMHEVHKRTAENIDPHIVYPRRRFSHFQEVQGRLDFLRFFIQEGQLLLEIKLLDEIWNCLTQNAIFPIDRTICFQWFSSFVDYVSDYDQEIFSIFLELNITKLDPSLVDIYGVECFEHFFKVVNIHEGKLIYKNHHYLMEDNDLTALDYLWKLILFGENEPAAKAINLLKDFYTNLGPKLIQSQVDIHHDFINTCFDRLKASYDTVTVIEFDQDGSKKRMELKKMIRVLSVLCEYINKCDGDFNHERSILPMSQCFRGKPVRLTIKLINFEDFEISTHTNEFMSTIKNMILQRSKRTETEDIEFYEMNEKIDLSKYKLVGQLTTKRKFNLSARFVNSNSISLINETDTSNYFKQKHVSQKHENFLPGVLMSKSSNYTNFLFQISDLAMSLKCDLLREKCSLILKLIPPDINYLNLIRDICINNDDHDNSDSLKKFEKELTESPTKTVYLLGIIYSLLLPANNQAQNDFQISFIKNRYFLLVLNYLNDKKFLINADNYCKICALLLILKISKFSLSTIFYLKIHLTIYPFDNDKILFIPSDQFLRNITFNVAKTFCKQIEPASFEKFNFVPTSEFINSVLMVAWSTAPGTWQFNVNTDGKTLHSYFIDNYSKNLNQIKSNDICDVCNEALELLTVIFTLAPEQIPLLVDDSRWHEFFIDLLLLCPDESIRTNMADQFTLILTKCVKNEKFCMILINILALMFQFLKTLVPNFYQTSSEFFQLFCNLLKFSFINNIRLPIVSSLLQYEYDLLENPKMNIYFNDQFDETLLEGHLKMTRELISFFNKSNNNYRNLVDLLMDQYLFVASKSLSLLQQNAQVSDDIYPICSGSRSLIAAYELLVALCTGCVDNLLYVCEKLETYFNGFPLLSWEYFPNIGTRPPGGFVGLKNAGATCYMNSVLQQLFMIPEVRNGILSVNIDSQYHFEETNDDNFFFAENKSIDSEDVKTYNINIFKQIQIIFGHLLLSQCQYYEPRGFWQHFRFMGAPINLREQQDALEFFNSLFDCLDEALKALNQAPIMTNIFGGLFSDQKICKDCPHRYCREESFTTLNVDIRNHQSLCDSLEQYVRGDLLEGDNAYYCEKCDRKVSIVKRLCLKKLPKVLVIQLKRFDYDYERETPIKFNDYFEFPNNLDMEPYTVNGLAKKEGEIIEEDLVQNDITQYELTGIVVHSGQANGGHYYSYILHQTDDGFKKWYKFDDVDVSECKLEQDEEMRINCFGGEYNAEVYDQIMKTKSQKIQNRWWNAFILVYRKVDESKTPPTNILPQMPSIIREKVQHQNIVFMNHRTLFSEEFYHFMRLFLECNSKNLNITTISNEELENIIKATLTIAAKFLFSFCFRTKKALRNNAVEWYEIILPYLQTDSLYRDWFITNHLLNVPNIFVEFLLECPSADVRTAFQKLIVLLTRFSLITKGSSVQYADNIMSILVNLIHKEVTEFIRQTSQYFNFFYQYATYGIEERSHLLKFDVPSLFMLLATDQGSGLTIKGQYIDLKLYQVVSILVRCCDTTELIQHISDSNHVPLPNPFKFEEDENYIIPLPENIQNILFSNNLYWRKIIREANTLEENVKLLKFCSWENQIFSKNLIEELLGLLGNSFTYEFEPYFKILQEVLLMNDTWETHRINFAFAGNKIYYNNGSSNFYKGIFEMMPSQLSHFDKRAFLCIQLLFSLLSSSKKAVSIVRENPMLKKKWLAALQCLREELDRRTQITRPYNSLSWCSPAMDSNRFFLDIPKSAHLYKSAMQIFADDDNKEKDNTYTNITDNNDDADDDDEESNNDSDRTDERNYQCKNINENIIINDDDDNDDDNNDDNVVESLAMNLNLRPSSSKCRDR